MMLSTAKKVEQKKEELRICAHTHSDVKSSFQTRYRHWCKEVKIKGKQSAADFNVRLSRKQHLLSTPRCPLSHRRPQPRLVARCEGGQVPPCVRVGAGRAYDTRSDDMRCLSVCLNVCVQRETEPASGASPPAAQSAARGEPWRRSSAAAASSRSRAKAFVTALKPDVA